jgi:hypothetical protein
MFNNKINKLNEQIDRSILELKIKNIIELKIKNIFQFKNKYIIELKNKSLIKEITLETKSEKIYNDKMYKMYKMYTDYYENNNLNNDLIIKQQNNLIINIDNYKDIINIDNYKDIINKLNIEEPYLITENDYQKLNDNIKSIYIEIKYEYIYKEVDLSIPFNWHEGPYYISKIKIYNYYKNKNIQNFIDNLHNNYTLKNSILQYILECDTINNIYYNIISDDLKINYYPYKFIDIDNNQYELTNEIKIKVINKIIKELTNNIICKLKNELQNEIYNKITDTLLNEIIDKLINTYEFKNRLKEELIDEVISKNKILITYLYKNINN